MGGVLGKGAGTTAQQPTAASGINLQSSCYGGVLPLAYGVCRVSPNIIWYDNFHYIAQNAPSSSGGGGGKGGVLGGGGKGGGQTTSGYEYYSDLILALCEGPINWIGPNMWVSQTETTLAAQGFGVFDGAYGQAIWSYLESTYPTQAVPYSGIAYVAAASYDLGTSANIPNFAFEVCGLLSLITTTYIGTVTSTQLIQVPHAILQGTSTASGVTGQSTTVYFVADLGVTYVATGLPVTDYSVDVYGNYTFGGDDVGLAVSINYTYYGDADPSTVVADILTNPYYGCGFPATRLGSTIQSNEAHTIPATGPYTIAVTNAATFLFNLAVVDNAGNIYSCVPTGITPGAKQYSFSAGVYTFNSANASTAITIRYVSLGGLTLYQQFTMASGLWISPYYDTQQQASSMLDALATATYSEWVWSSGVLTLIPRGTVNVSGNNFNFVAPVTPLFDLDDDDFLPNVNATGTSTSSSNDDPVILSRTRPADQNNDFKLEFLDRQNQYAASVVEISDMGRIDKFGRRTNGSQQGHFFCDINAANTSAQLQVQDEYIMNTYSITLDSRYCMLDPMDIVTITDAKQGINKLWVRILEITENDDGTLSINAEEYPGGTGAAAEYNLNQGQGYSQSFNADPGTPVTPIIFEPPTLITTGNGLEIWVATAGINKVYGGSDVWVSNDGVTYALAGRASPPCRMGVTTLDFPVGSDPDTTDSLKVDLTQSQGALDSGTQSDADLGHTLCYVAGYPIPNAPMLAVVAGGSLGARTEYVRATYVFISGESPASPEESIVLTSGELNTAMSPPAQQGATGWNLYASLVSGEETLQNGSPIAIGVGWTEPTSGLVLGATAPASETSYELVSYETADLTAAFEYTLGTYLRRGMYTSTITDHQAGSAFTRLDSGILAIPYTREQIGLTVYIKLLPINIYGGGQPTLADVQPYAHVIVGPPLPGTVIGFFAQQNGGAVAFNWDALTGYPIMGYDILYAPMGDPLTDAIFLTEGGSGTESTNAAVPPGTWTFFIRGRDIANQVGPASSFNLVVVDESNVVLLDDEAPGWTGTMSGFVPHYLGYLVPDSAKAANLHTNAQLFEHYVLFPVATSTYTSLEIDLGFADTLSVYFEQTAALGRGNTGSITSAYALDAWETGSDPNTFTPWTIGEVDLRYLRGQIVFTNTAGSVGMLQDFRIAADRGTDITAQGLGVTIAPGGTAITFGETFHLDPLVLVQVIGSTALYAVANTITTTGCTIHIFNSSGSDVGGTVNWQASGV